MENHCWEGVFRSSSFHTITFYPTFLLVLYKGKRGKMFRNLAFIDSTYSVYVFLFLLLSRIVWDILVFTRYFHPSSFSVFSSLHVLVRHDYLFLRHHLTYYPGLPPSALQLSTTIASLRHHPQHYLASSPPISLLRLTTTYLTIPPSHYQPHCFVPPLFHTCVTSS